MNLIKYNQFDTVYHEHYSYLSISFILKIFQKYGLKIYDVKKLNTHGGSLRVYGCHKDKKIRNFYRCRQNSKRGKRLWPNR